MNLPTPALAKAGAAPGTTTGVEHILRCRLPSFKTYQEGPKLPQPSLATPRAPKNYSNLRTLCRLRNHSILLLQCSSVAKIQNPPKAPKLPQPSAAAPTSHSNLVFTVFKSAVCQTSKPIKVTQPSAAAPRATALCLRRRPHFTWSFGESFRFARTNHDSSFLAFNISTKPSPTKPPIRHQGVSPFYE